MEMADVIAITKADGPNKIPADKTMVSFQNALNLFPVPLSGWRPKALTCSAKQNTGIREIRDSVVRYVEYTKQTGFFDRLKKQQAVVRMHDAIFEYFNNSFYNNKEIRRLAPELERQLNEGTITSYKAVLTLIDRYNKK